MGNKNYILIYTVLSIFLFYNCRDGKDDTVINFKEREKIEIKFGSKSEELIFVFKYIEELNQKRIFLDFKMSSELKIGGINDETFLYPARIRIDKEKNFYVLDFLDFNVKKFDKSGKFISKFGRKGKGPGELMDPFDFDVYLDGSIVFLGENDNKFILLQEGMIKDVNTKLMPNRICFVSKEEIVTFQIMDPINQSPLIKTHLNEGKIVNYENFIDKNSFGGKEFGVLPFLIGDIHRYESNNLVYISSILGYVILFDQNGKISKAFKLIERYKESELERKEKITYNTRTIGFPRQEEYLFESSNIYQDNLFIFVNPIKFDPKQYIIDVYSLSKGIYKYSMQFKDETNIKEVFLTNDRIYLIRENTELEVFKYSLNN